MVPVDIDFLREGGGASSKLTILPYFFESIYSHFIDDKIVTMKDPFRNWLFKGRAVRVLSYPSSLNIVFDFP